MNESGSRKTAVVTGASAGIGAATVHRLVADGFRVVAGARRLERVRAVAEPVGAAALALDVTDPASIAAFLAGREEIQGPALHLLVNNAGGALGLDPVATADEERWQTMFETNVLGTLRMTRELLPALLASEDGHVVNVGSIAGFETYPGGAGYTAAKHALRALTRTLRLELLGRPVRVTEIAPGLVETEFSLRQHMIEQYQVGWLLRDPLERGAGSAHAGEAVAGQGLCVKPQLLGLVLDNQNGRCKFFTHFAIQFLLHPVRWAMGKLSPPWQARPPARAAESWPHAPARSSRPPQLHPRALWCTTWKAPVLCRVGGFSSWS